VIAAQACGRQNAIALSCEGESLTCGQLDRRFQPVGTYLGNWAWARVRVACVWSEACKWWWAILGVIKGRRRLVRWIRGIQRNG